jgi:deoxyadenosine/deoxycytidine kinase
MPILCLEGASAVGKSTTCKELSKRYGAFVVEEVAFLFRKPNLEDHELVQWLLERQVERWKIAVNKLNDHDLVILDGDHFKIWYSWIYGFQSENLDFFKSYFRNLILSKDIGFPDSYVVLTINEEELRRRKANDLTRKRGNFEKHLRLIEPQIRFFRAINQYMPDYIQFIEASSIEHNVENIDTKLQFEGKYSTELFDYMINWFKANTP